MKEKTMTGAGGHVWHFIQTSGLVQLEIKSIDDILNLRDLNQKLWVALACPVKGLEFSEETLSMLDTDKNGRVRAPEILDAVEFIRTNFKKPEVIMTPGASIPLDALGEAPFSCGHSPLESAKSVLHILEKDDAGEISLDDVAVNEKLFSPAVINGDGVLPPEAVGDEFAAGVVTDIASCTGGADDISGAKGVTEEQFTTFFADLRALKAWRNDAQRDAPGIFFLDVATDAAAAAYMKVRAKINEYYERCSLDSYNSDAALSLRKKEEELLAADGAELPRLPLAQCESDKALPFGNAINPAWKADMEAFRTAVAVPLFGEGKTRLTEADWAKIEARFAPYMAWYEARPENSAVTLSFERVDEILASDAEQLIAARFAEESAHPPIALATVELRKMLLLRRDFVELLKNFVSFENLYARDVDAVFQCGTLYIDGRSCELCFRVLDAAKHATMSPFSQCYLLYCDCKRPSTNEAMQIAAMVSAGNRDNLMVGRNGLFYDREGKDWDATITKIVENPISIREAFWMPYKKFARMIQERVNKMAADAESKSDAKLAAVANSPTEAAQGAAASVNANPRRFDVGAIAAMSVAFTGIATVVGGLLSAFFGLGYWVPLGVAGIVLLISLPSMFIAWLKLRRRNIAPVLDASGWAVNGNVRINIPLGRLLTQTAVRPRGSKLNLHDPYAQKGFPIKRVLLGVVLLALVIVFVVMTIRNPHGISGVLADFKSGLANVGAKFVPKAAETIVD